MSEWGFLRYLQRTMRSVSFLTQPVRKLRLRSGYTKKGPNLVVGRGLKRRRGKRKPLRNALIVGVIVLTALGWLVLYTVG